MEARAMRVIIAALAVPSVSAGRLMMARLAPGLRVSDTHCKDGIHPR